MLYIVKSRDTLAAIASKFNTTVPAILAANVICNPDYIFIGEPLIIPDPNISLPKSGGSPYYIIATGDTIWCLSQQFARSPETLMQVNQITNPSQLLSGTELLVSTDITDPNLLYDSWNIGEEDCNYINSIWGYEVFYKGEFHWEALGERAVPYLKRLLNHSCYIVRSSTVRSLGRIGKGEATRLALQQALDDPDADIVGLARIALKRMELVSKLSKRIHVTMYRTELFTTPSFQPQNIELQEGTPIIVLHWNIPSPEGETSGPGALAVFDLVQVVATGQKGFILRAGYGAITFL